MDDNTVKLIREAQRRGEKRLDALLTMALAADARAMSFGGVMIAASAILGGLAADASNPWPLIVTAFGLVVAAAVAISTAQPADFYAPGGLYSNLFADIEGNVPINEVLRALAAQEETYCLKNQMHLMQNGNIMNVSFLIALISPLIGVMVGIAF